MRIELGLIKVEINLPEISQALENFNRNRARAFETLVAEAKQSVGEALEQLMKPRQ